MIAEIQTTTFYRLIIFDHMTRDEKNKFLQSKKNSIYINKKFDYKSKIIVQNLFEYEFNSNDNSYLFKTFIRFSVPKIDKRIINSFTNNILSTIEFKSSIGTSRNYILNFINDFVYHF